MSELSYGFGDYATYHSRRPLPSTGVSEGGATAAGRESFHEARMLPRGLSLNLLGVTPSGNFESGPVSRPGTAEARLGSMSALTGWSQAGG